MATREFSHMNENKIMELVDGLEPPTCWLQISCSTNWATPACIAWSVELTISIISYLQALVKHFLFCFHFFNKVVEATGLEPAASWSQTKHSTKLSYASSSTSIIISYLHRFVNTFFCFFVQIPPSFSLCPCRCEKERSKAVFCSEPYLTSLLKLFIIKQYKEFVFPHLFALAGLRV